MGLLDDVDWDAATAEYEANEVKRSGYGAEDRAYLRRLNPDNDSNFAMDTVRDLGRAAIGVVDTAVGLADLGYTAVTGESMRGKLDDMGYRPDQWTNELNLRDSFARQDARAEVDSAEGFFDTAAALIANPRELFGEAVQQLPNLYGMTAAAKAAAKQGLIKGAQKGLEGKALQDYARGYATAAAGVAEGALTTGSVASAIAGEKLDQGELADRGDMGYAIAAGVGTGLIGAGMARLGAGTEAALGQRLAGGSFANTVGRNALTRTGKAFVAEGTEEALQSGQEEIFTNLGADNEWNEGLGKAMGQGFVLGGAMGGATHAATGALDSLSKTVSKKATESQSVLPDANKTAQATVTEKAGGQQAIADEQQRLRNMEIAKQHLLGQTEGSVYGGFATLSANEAQEIAAESAVPAPIPDVAVNNELELAKQQEALNKPAIKGKKTPGKFQERMAYYNMQTSGASEYDAITQSDVNEKYEQLSPAQQLYVDLVLAKADETGNRNLSLKEYNELLSYAASIQSDEAGLLKTLASRKSTSRAKSGLKFLDKEVTNAAKSIEATGGNLADLPAKWRQGGNKAPQQQGAISTEVKAPEEDKSNKPKPNTPDVITPANDPLADLDLGALALSGEELEGSAQQARTFQYIGRPRKDMANVTAEDYLEAPSSRSTQDVTEEDFKAYAGNEKATQALKNAQATAEKIRNKELFLSTSAMGKVREGMVDTNTGATMPVFRLAGRQNNSDGSIRGNYADGWESLKYRDNANNTAEKQAEVFMRAFWQDFAEMFDKAPKEAIATESSFRQETDTQSGAVSGSNTVLESNEAPVQKSKEQKEADAVADEVNKLVAEYDKAVYGDDDSEPEHLQNSSYTKDTGDRFTDSLEKARIKLGGRNLRDSGSASKSAKADMSFDELKTVAAELLDSALKFFLYDSEGKKLNPRLFRQESTGESAKARRADKKHDKETPAATKAIRIEDQVAESLVAPELTRGMVQAMSIRSESEAQGAVSSLFDPNSSEADKRKALTYAVTPNKEASIDGYRNALVQLTPTGQRVLDVIEYAVSEVSNVIKNSPRSMNEVEAIKVALKNHFKRNYLPPDMASDHRAYKYIAEGNVDAARYEIARAKLQNKAMDSLVQAFNSGWRQGMSGAKMPLKWEPKINKGTGGLIHAGISHKGGVFTKDVTQKWGVFVKERFLQTFGNTVRGVPLEERIEFYKQITNGNALELRFNRNAETAGSDERGAYRFFVNGTPNDGERVADFNAKDLRLPSWLVASGIFTEAEVRAASELTKSADQRKKITDDNGDVVEGSDMLRALFQDQVNNYKERAFGGADTSYETERLKAFAQSKNLDPKVVKALEKLAKEYETAEKTFVSVLERSVHKSLAGTILNVVADDLRDVVDATLQYMAVNNVLHGAMTPENNAVRRVLESSNYKFDDEMLGELGNQVDAAQTRLLAHVYSNLNTNLTNEEASSLDDSLIGLVNNMCSLQFNAARVNYSLAPAQEAARKEARETRTKNEEAAQKIIAAEEATAKKVLDLADGHTYDSLTKAAEKNPIAKRGLEAAQEATKQILRGVISDKGVLNAHRSAIWSLSDQINAIEKLSPAERKWFTTAMAVIFDNAGAKSKTLAALNSQFSNEFAAANREKLVNFLIDRSTRVFTTEGEGGISNYGDIEYSVEKRNAEHALYTDNDQVADNYDNARFMLSDELVVDIVNQAEWLSDYFSSENYAGLPAQLKEKVKEQLKINLQVYSAADAKGVSPRVRSSLTDKNKTAMERREQARGAWQARQMADIKNWIRWYESNGARPYASMESMQAAAAKVSRSAESTRLAVARTPREDFSLTAEEKKEIRQSRMATDALNANRRRNAHGNVASGMLISGIAQNDAFAVSPLAPVLPSAKILETYHSQTGRGKLFPNLPANSQERKIASEVYSRLIASGMPKDVADKFMKSLYVRMAHKKYDKDGNIIKTESDNSNGSARVLDSGAARQIILCNNKGDSLGKQVFFGCHETLHHVFGSFQTTGGAHQDKRMELSLSLGGASPTRTKGSFELRDIIVPQGEAIKQLLDFAEKYPAINDLLKGYPGLAMIQGIPGYDNAPQVIKELLCQMGAVYMYDQAYADVIWQEAPALAELIDEYIYKYENKGPDNGNRLESTFRRGLRGSNERTGSTDRTVESTSEQGNVKSNASEPSGTNSSTGGNAGTSQDGSNHSESRQLGSEPSGGTSQVNQEAFALSAEEASPYGGKSSKTPKTDTKLGEWLSRSFFKRIVDKLAHIAGLSGKYGKGFFSLEEVVKIDPRYKGLVGNLAATLRTSTGLPRDVVSQYMDDHIYMFFDPAEATAGAFITPAINGKRVICLPDFDSAKHYALKKLVNRGTPAEQVTHELLEDAIEQEFQQALLHEYFHELDSDNYYLADKKTKLDLIVDLDKGTMEPQGLYSTYVKAARAVDNELIALVSEYPGNMFEGFKQKAINVLGPDKATPLHVEVLAKGYIKDEYYAQVFSHVLGNHYKARTASTSWAVNAREMTDIAKEFYKDGIEKHIQKINGSRQEAAYEGSQRRDTDGHVSRSDRTTRGSDVEGRRVQENQVSQEAFALAVPDPATDEAAVDAVTGPSKTKEFIDNAISKLPESWQNLAHNVVRTLDGDVGEFLRSLNLGFSFLENIVNKYKKVLPSLQTYLDAVKKREFFRNAAEEYLSRFIQRSKGFDKQVLDQINRFLEASTLDRVWGFRPSWIPSDEFDQMLLKDNNRADFNMMSDKFNALPKEAQEFVKDMFEYSHRMYEQKLAAMEKHADDLYGEAIKEENDPVAKKTLDDEWREAKRKIQTVRRDGRWPYMPLIRSGSHAVVLYSPTFREAKKDFGKLAALYRKGELTEEQLVEYNELKEKIRNLQQDENHYIVTFVNGQGTANRTLAELKAKHPGMDGDAFVRREAAYQDKISYASINALEEAIYKRMDGTETTAQARKYMQQMLKSLNDIYIDSLAETHARKADKARRNVRGYNPDMLANFLEQGNREIHYVANISQHTQIRDALRAMGEEAKDNDSSVERKHRALIYNEVLKREALDAEYKPSEFVDKIQRFNSVMMLLTSPAYYLQNATQPFLMSAPYMCGRFSAAQVYSKLNKDFMELAKVFVNAKGTPDLRDPSVMSKACYEALQLSRAAGNIDIGMAQDFGNLQNPSAIGRATDKLSAVARKMEMLNRVATFKTAFELRYEEAIGEGLTPEKAQEAAYKYADKVIYDTHGNYSAFNEPRFFKRGGLGGFGFKGAEKLIFQFRKFQLIQLGLMCRLAKDSIAGDPVARKAFAHVLGVHFAMTGLKGTPFAMLAMSFMSLFGAEGDDDEDVIREMIGDKSIADLLMGGLPTMIGVDISERVGAGNMTSLFPFLSVDPFDGKDEANETLVALGGPVASQAVKAMTGLGLMRDGEYWKGAEKLLPNGLANAMRGIRYATEGYTNSSGVVTIPDSEISGMEAFFQGIGFTPKTMTDKFRLQTKLERTEAEFERQEKQLNKAFREAAGDRAERMRIQREYVALQKRREALGFKPKAVTQLLKNEEKALKDSKNAIGGVISNSTNSAWLEYWSKL